MEMISSVPISSAGIHIRNADPYTGFTSWNVGGTPVVGLPGVLATVHLPEDPVRPWGIFNATWFGLPQGLMINAGPTAYTTPEFPWYDWLGLGM